MNPKNIVLLVAVMTATFLGGCYQRDEVSSRPCTALGKITDPAIKATSKNLRHISAKSVKF